MQELDTVIKTKRRYLMDSLSSVESVKLCGQPRHHMISYDLEQANPFIQIETATHKGGGAYV